MTGKDAYDVAISHCTDEFGRCDVFDNYKLQDRAVDLINRMQKEIAFHEGISMYKFPIITSIDDELVISENSGLGILPYGLAASFLFDEGAYDLSGEYSFMYWALIRTIDIKEPA